MCRWTLLLPLLALGSAQYADFNPEEEELSKKIPPEFKMTKEILLNQLAEEHYTVLDAERYVKRLYSRVVQAMREAVQNVLLEKMKIERDDILEKLEDISIEHETLDLSRCLGGKEELASQIYVDTIESMRLCVEAESDEGVQLAQDVAEKASAVEPLVQNLRRLLKECVDAADEGADEEDAIKQCFQKEDIRELFKEKTEKLAKLDPLMQKVFKKEKSSNRCLADEFEKMKLSIEAIREFIDNCVAALVDMKKDEL